MSSKKRCYRLVGVQAASRERVHQMKYTLPFFSVCWHWPHVCRPYDEANAVVCARGVVRAGYDGTTPEPSSLFEPVVVAPVVVAPGCRRASLRVGKRRAGLPLIIPPHRSIRRLCPFKRRAAALDAEQTKGESFMKITKLACGLGVGAVAMMVVWYVQQPGSGAVVDLYRCEWIYRRSGSHLCAACGDVPGGCRHARCMVQRLVQRPREEALRAYRAR